MLRLRVPATIANLGPGYDVLGMAVGLHNGFNFDRAERWTVHGTEHDPEDHLTLMTARRAAEHFGGQCPPISVSQLEEVPRARGLGSSATARVAGLEAGLHYAGLQVSLQDKLDFLTEQEGHPDNVVPAFVGGLTICARVQDTWQHVRLDPPRIQVALCVPQHEVSTREARRRMPEALPLADYVHNASALAFLMAGLINGDLDLWKHGLSDRVHTPHRAPLIGPVDAAFSEARAAGALGAVVSGSGSTLAAMVPPGVSAHKVAEAMAHGLRGIPCSLYVKAPEAQGCTVLAADLD